MRGPSKPRSPADIVAAALDEHRAALAAFVRARVLPHEVDDVLQVAAMRAIERVESLREAASIRAWLFAVHRNVATDVMRTRASQQRLQERATLEATATVATEPAPRDSCRCSVAQARKLGERHASILALVDLEGRSLSEASRVLGISTNNATVRLHRARKALRQRMLEHCGTTSLRECADCRCVDAGCCEA